MEPQCAYGEEEARREGGGGMPGWLTDWPHEPMLKSRRARHCNRAHGQLALHWLRHGGPGVRVTRCSAPSPSDCDGTQCTQESWSGLLARPT